MYHLPRNPDLYNEHHIDMIEKVLARGVYPTVSIGDKDDRIVSLAVPPRAELADHGVVTDLKFTITGAVDAYGDHIETELF